VQDPEIARTPNETFFAECLAGGPFTRRETVIRNVCRLEGGSSLTVDCTGIKHRRYYDLAAAKPIRFASYDDCAAALREVLTEAVRCRMRAAGDVGSHLSGGLDSSSIVSIAHDLARRGEVGNRIRPFSLVFTDPDADENEFIAEVERHLNFSTERCAPFAPDTEYLAEYSRKTLELPRYPNATMTDGLERAVVSRGLRVCLSGLGGDHTMDGATDDLAAVVRGVHPIRFVRALYDLRRNIATGEVMRSFIDVVFRSAIWPLVPAPARGLVRRALGRDDESPSYSWRSWVDPSFAERHALVDRARAADSEWGNRPLALHAIWYLLHDGWFTYVMEGNERNAARAGLEYRYPYCDRRVIEFVCGLAEEQRWNQGVPRLLMRRAMRGLLIETVRNRSTKAHFDDFGMRQLKRLGDSLADSLTVEKMCWIGGARLRQAQDSAWRFYQSRDQRYADFQWNVFAALSVEVLMRNLPDRPTTPMRNLEQPPMETTGTCL
jgi:asparagine synthase (glutamine-hydrolysing)